VSVRVVFRSQNRTVFVFGASVRGTGVFVVSWCVWCMRLVVRVVVGSIPLGDGVY
jgi:hypothetical protein